jgi:hypothetical protein
MANSTQPEPRTPSLTRGGHTGRWSQRQTASQREQRCWAMDIYRAGGASKSAILVCPKSRRLRRPKADNYGQWAHRADPPKHRVTLGKCASGRHAEVTPVGESNSLRKRSFKTRHRREPSRTGAARWSTMPPFPNYVRASGARF